MAYKTKFLHFKTKASYNAERAKTTAGTEARKVFDAYIAFIDEGPVICTWGKEYKCDIGAAEIESLSTAIDAEISRAKAAEKKLTDDLASEVTRASEEEQNIKDDFSKLEEQINNIIGTIVPSDNVPYVASNLGSAGTSNLYARWDHVHPEQINITGNASTASSLETARTITLGEDATGSVSFDGSNNVTLNVSVKNDSHSHSDSTITSLDASKITSGTISIDRLPKGALERLVIVANEAARFALTSNDVQEGDTVKQSDTGVMYYVVNKNKLDSESGYVVYTAGAATSVPWSGVTDRPSKLSEFSNDSGFTTNKGTVTSVGLTVPEGLSVTGSPITASGTFAVKYATGYSIPTTTKQNEWTTAYSWGNHASAGYAKATQLGNYLPLTGGTLTGRLIINSSNTTQGQLTINMTNARYGVVINNTYDDTYTEAHESLVYFKINGAYKGIVGFNEDYGTYLYTSDGYHRLNIKDGVGYINNSVIFTHNNIIQHSNELNIVPTDNNSIEIFINYRAVNQNASITTPIDKFTFCRGISSSSGDIYAKISAKSFITVGGTSSQLVCGDGSLTAISNLSKVLKAATLSGATINAGYNYNNTSITTISTLSGFSETNPDSVIISTKKITFNVTNAIKIDGLDELSGDYYIYCLSWMANGKIAINGAIYL